jgi:hypothetical protein
VCLAKYFQQSRPLSHNDGNRGREAAVKLKLGKDEFAMESTLIS